MSQSYSSSKMQEACGRGDDDSLGFKVGRSHFELGDCGFPKREINPMSSSCVEDKASSMSGVGGHTGWSP